MDNTSSHNDYLHLVNKFTNKRNNKLKLLEMTDVDRIKILLNYINNLINSDSDKLNITYQAVSTNSIIGLYFFDSDLVIFMIKSDDIVNTNESEKMVKLIVKRISNYGERSNLTQSKFEIKEIQPFLKFLFFKIVDIYYRRINKIDSILEDTVHFSKSTYNLNNKINNALIDNITGFINEDMKDNVKDVIKRFDKFNNKILNKNFK